MNTIFKTTKNLLYNNAELSLGDFSDYYILRMDIEIKNSFNHSSISIGTEQDHNLILSNYDISDKTSPINVEGFGKINQSLFLYLNGSPTEGELDITIYYIHSSSFIEKTITYQNFTNITYDIGQVNSLNRVSDIIIKISSSFNKGKISLKQGETTIIENDIIDLTEENTYIFEYHQEHNPSLPFTLHFEEFPDYGSLLLILIFFPIKG